MNKPQRQEQLKALPAVGKLIELEEVQAWLTVAPRKVVVESLQHAIDETRKALLSGRDVSIDEETILGVAEAMLAHRTMPSLVGVVNATGIVLHTGLGRAPLCSEALEAIAEGAGGYCNLEFDLESGERGRRVDHVNRLLAELTGAESATVVNNNAAATYMLLHTLAHQREVVVSRGQLVEIGGSFRLPDIMAASGALLREVGTTNRTRIDDYRRAIGPNTAALMRVHSSNYRIAGFSQQATLEELVLLAREFKLLMIDDLGSGALIETPVFAASDEPIVVDSIKTGADAVCFSGDKLLGGPQCGVIAGREAVIRQIETSPLMRTYRVGKLTLLALEATLRHWVDADHAMREIPTMAMLGESIEAMRSRGTVLHGMLRDAMPGEKFVLTSGPTFAGGGSLPNHAIEGVRVEWSPAALSANEAARRLRTGQPPIITRVHQDRICFELRTLRDEDFDLVVEAVAECRGDDDASLLKRGHHSFLPPASQ